MLRGLLGPATIMPRLLPSWQIYHSKVTEVVAAEYKRRVKPGHDGIGLRNEIARELFAALSEDEQKEVDEEAMERHERELEEHTRKLIGEPSIDPETQKA